MWPARARLGRKILPCPALPVITVARKLSECSSGSSTSHTSMEPMIISSMSSIRRALADRISFRRYRYLAENRRRLGSRLYKAKLTAENPVDTVQSIEHALRGLDQGR